jgi:biopolymer transport protein ExbB
VTARRHARGVSAIALIVFAVAARGAESPPAAAVTNGAAADPVAAKMNATLEELNRVRERIAAEKIPMAEELSRLESALMDARKEYEVARRQVDGRSLDLNALRNEIKAHEQEQVYLANLFGEYLRNLESRIHIAEMQRYRKDFEDARLAPERSDLKPAERFAVQARVIGRSLDRLEELTGGLFFDGRAAGEDGLVKPGRFALIGPFACFSSEDGTLAGLAEQRIGSLEPSVAGFAEPAWAAMTRDLVNSGRGTLPFDGSLGNARKIEETREPLDEHIRKGGAVMVPLLGMGALIGLLALGKWIALSRVRLPGRRRFDDLLAVVRSGNPSAAAEALRKTSGPAGRMLRAGLERWGSSKEIVEEAMFEVMLDVRFKLNRGLPFIAVGAACAPLLGLLGTVTGIISTFKLITVFGSGDVKMLSAGISEALITTEFGLLVAIPSLLFHAFLSRKARGLLDKMEQMALVFLGVLAEHPPAPKPVEPAPPPAADAALPAEVAPAC